MPKTTRFALFRFSSFRTILCMSIAVMVVARFGGVAYADTESSAFPRDGTLPHLLLAWNDPHRLFPLGSNRVQCKVTAIFKRIGIQTKWVNPKSTYLRVPTEAACASNPKVVEIRVVLVQSDASSWGLRRHVMGVVLSRKEPQSAVYIIFPSVARVLGYNPEVLRNRLPTECEKRDMVLALSRVVVHEVFHAVAPELPHASDGLTRATLGRDLLVTAKARIHPDAAKAFHRAMASRSRLDVAVIGPTKK